MSPAVLVLVSSLALGAGADTPGEGAPRTGWDFAGLPLINFTTDRGLGYGAYVAAFDHGESTARGHPYLASFGAQLYRTTKGYQFHKLLADFPDIFGTGLRFDLTVGYETWADAWYFGQGNSTPRLPVADTPDHFYAFDVKSVWIVPNLRIPISGPWSLFSGGTVRYAEVGVYPGSRLERDRPVGIEGGLLDLLTVGVLVDTRDREPSPGAGIFSELSLRGSSPLFGSRFEYFGVNFTHRQWATVIDEVLVLAFRAGADLQTSGAPFFHQHILGGSQWVEVGGNLSLRGLPSGRYRGNVTAFGDVELRFTAARGPILGRDFELLLTPFVDAARVFAWHDAAKRPDVHLTFGGGPRLIYDDVFVVRLDFACGVEEYASVASPLGTEVERRAPVLGIYGIVNHAF